MLRKFKIAIDNKEYLVEMEEIGGVNNPSANAAPVEEFVSQQRVEETKNVEEPISQPIISESVGAEALTAPMPGAILKVLVNVGEAVKQNQPIMILEAMKMENEIVANHDGIVKGIHVQQGDVVNPGDALITIS